MPFVTVLYALGFYFAALVLIAGVSFKIYQWATTPQPLKIPVMPAPMTKAGVAVRLFREVTIFESLFKSNKWIWIFAIIFHAALLLALLRHLRYFIDPVWFWVDLVQPFGMYAGFAMVAGLLGLWGRRLLVDRVRYISALSDHLMLALLVLIGASGLSLRYLARTDIIQTKAFFRGLLTFDWQPLPTDPVLLLHLGLVWFLLVVFPFSKLLHVPGVFFHPSRNQTDTARAKRHTAPWTPEMDAKRDAAMTPTAGE